MRACIAVESPEKLWIYDLTKQEYHVTEDVEELSLEYRKLSWT